jgi:hypothetical protein
MAALTEADWLGEGDPQTLLGLLRNSGVVSVRSKGGRRKLRLFAAACCRRIEQLLAGDLARRAIEGVERWAEGQADGPAVTELQRAVQWESNRAANELRLAPGLFAPENARRRYSCETSCWAAQALLGALQEGSWDAASDGARGASMAERRAAWGTREGNDWYQASCAAENVAQRELLCEVFGNPFQPVKVEPALLKWNGGAVRHLAEAIYRERNFADLPVLADALEEAGCAEPSLLDHCRRPSGHVLGCWALDTLTGRA